MLRSKFQDKTAISLMQNDPQDTTRGGKPSSGDNNCVQNPPLETKQEVKSPTPGTQSFTNIFINSDTI